MHCLIFLSAESIVGLECQKQLVDGSYAPDFDQQMTLASEWREIIFVPFYGNPSIRVVYLDECSTRVINRSQSRNASDEYHFIDVQRRVQILKKRWSNWFPRYRLTVKMHLATPFSNLFSVPIQMKEKMSLQKSHSLRLYWGVCSRLAIILSKREVWFVKVERTNRGVTVKSIKVNYMSQFSQFLNIHKKWLCKQSRVDLEIVFWLQYLRDISLLRKVVQSHGVLSIRE